MFKKNHFNYLFVFSFVLPILPFFFLSSNNEQSTYDVAAAKSKEKLDTVLSMFFVGDLMGHEPIINAARVSGKEGFNYKPWFKYLEPFVEKVDYAIVNLEVTLGGEPYSGYPTFSSPDDYAKHVQQVGFDMFITANNHSLDRGQKGLERTIDVLNKLNIDHTGTFKNKSERELTYPLIKEFYGKKIAFLNCTYGTNGIKVQEPNIVNLIDTLEIREDLNSARQKGADLIVFTVHWGQEYQRNENAEQGKIAQWLADNGVDAIIGMHPHVIQPMKIIHPKTNPTKDVPVAYSLGNFVSNQRERYKDGGIGVRLTIHVTDSGVAFKSWDYLPFWIQRGGTKYGYYPIPATYYETNSKELGLNSTETLAINEFISDTRALLSNVKEWKLNE
jgi:hypothetical protein